jgi:mRNA interferase MazF
MGRFIKGDVVVIPFPFSDLSSSKKRPALVLVELDGDDVILCQITSQNVKDNNAIAIEVSDIENGTLNTYSNARPNKLFTADNNIIAYKIGRLNPLKMEAVTKAVVKMFEK